MAPREPRETQQGPKKQEALRKHERHPKWPQESANRAPRGPRDASYRLSERDRMLLHIPDSGNSPGDVSLDRLVGIRFFLSRPRAKAHTASRKSMARAY
eukprot:9487811-Pyramimonas_sp.AAC.1